MGWLAILVLIFLLILFKFHNDPDEQMAGICTDGGASPIRLSKISIQRAQFIILAAHFSIHTFIDFLLFFHITVDSVKSGL